MKLKMKILNIFITKLVSKLVLLMFKTHSSSKDPFKYLASKILCVKESDITDSQRSLFKSGLHRALFNKDIEKLVSINTSTYRWVLVGEHMHKDDEWYEENDGTWLKTLSPITVCNKKSFYRRKV
jgi:hypothetical protein